MSWTNLNRVAVVTAVVTMACLVGLLAPRVEAAVADGAEEADPVKASLVADADALTPGGTITLGVRLTMKPHWHTYWINPGESGDATQIKLTGPQGMIVGPIQWPLPSRIDAPGGVSFGYENEVLLMVPVTLPADTSAKGEVAIRADVAWLVCKEECIKGDAKLEIKLPVSASQGQPANPKLFETWRARLPVPADHPSVAKSLQNVEQSGGSGTQLLVKWKQAPRKVEWFPVASRAVAIDNVKVSQHGPVTQISFEPTVYKPDGVPDGRVDSVLVFEDADGRRVGVSVPIAVDLKK